jgi:hypothetical protein
VTEFKINLQLKWKVQKWTFHVLCSHLRNHYDHSYFYEVFKTFPCADDGRNRNINLYTRSLPCISTCSWFAAVYPATHTSHEDRTHKHAGIFNLERQPVLALPHFKSRMLTYQYRVTLMFRACCFKMEVVGSFIFDNDLLNFTLEGSNHHIFSHEGRSLVY